MVDLSLCASCGADLPVRLYRGKPQESLYRGVGKAKKNGKWFGSWTAWHDGKYLGTFPSEDEAAAAVEAERGAPEPSRRCDPCIRDGRLADRPATRPCAGCGIPLALRGVRGAERVRCEACAEVHCRTRAAAAYAVRAGAARAARQASLPPCMDCGGPLPSGSRSTRLRCDACNLARDRALRRGAKKSSRPAAPHACWDCGCPVGHAGSLPPSLRTCAGCAAERILVLDVAAGPCAVCGAFMAGLDCSACLRAAKGRRKLERRGDRHWNDPAFITVAYLLERDRWRCGICRKRIFASYRYPDPRSPSRDHIIPLACGGRDARENLQAAHLGCNTRKGAGGAGEQLLLVG